MTYKGMTINLSNSKKRSQKIIDYYLFKFCEKLTVNINFNIARLLFSSKAQIKIFLGLKGLRVHCLENITEGNTNFFQE